MSNNREPSISGVREFEEVDISSTNHTFTEEIRALYVGGAGDVILTTKGGASITLTALAAGVLHPIAGVASITKVGTTATGILGAY